MNEPLAPVCVTFHTAVELVGRRWTGAIINSLMPGRARYAALRAAIPAITDRMLSERLRELEVEGIVVRHVTPDTPVRVEYELTPKGAELKEAFTALEAWAGKWAMVPVRGRKKKSA